jgi:hypothetical protein
MLTMRQAITTKFIPPTDTRGSRVKATAAAGSKTLYWDHALNIEDNHAAAARALANRFEWSGNWYGGGLAREGFVFVCDDGDGFTTEGRN